MFRYFFTFFLFSFCYSFGQQNLTFYSFSDVPHTNFLNPAVQSSCTWYVGVPFLSSLHLNYGNSFGSVRDFMQFNNLNQAEFLRNISHTGHVNTELQLNLFSFGYAADNSFWSFAITDKLDVAMFAPKSMAEFILKGNRNFEGRSADFSGSLFANYYREYSLGWAKKISAGRYIGFHGKLLFGKANISTTNSKSSLYTDPNTFDLNFQSAMKINSSLPFALQIDQNGVVHDASTNVPVSSFLLNRKNIGLAADAGFIRNNGDGIIWEGSILDLGIIYWTTNPYNYSHTGTYVYNGPLGDTLGNRDYIHYVYDEATRNLHVQWTKRNYISFLTPRIYLGFKKEWNHIFAWSFTGTAKIYRYQVIPGLTAGMEANISKSIVTTISFSYLNRSFKNLGWGVVIGNHPIQFYAVTDNLLGIIYPLRYRTVNLRTGLILRFGCNRKKQVENCGCEWLRQSEEQNERNQRLMHQ